MPRLASHLFPALKIASIYAVFGGLWIMLSDTILGALVTDLATYSTLQTYKGWLYILITSVLIFQLADFYLKREAAAQEELMISEERYDLALQGANVGTWDWDLLTNDVIYNEEYTRMLGYQKHEFPPIYSSWEALIHPDDKPKVLEGLDTHFAGESEGLSVEFRMLTAARQWKWVLGRGKVFRWDEEGNPTRAAGVHIDLSKHRAAEKELQTARDAAEAANVAKGLFLINMSNEIKKPLHTLQLEIDRMQRTELSEGAATQLTAVLNAEKDLLAILNTMLDFSQIKAIDTKSCSENLDLSSLAQTVEGVFKSQSEKSGVALHFDLAPDIPDTLCGDQGKLRQILFNLVGNALKFTEYGEVRVSAVAVPDQRPGGNTLVLFEVKDTGIGISPNRLVTIFDPITKAASDTQGTGLGIHIVSRLIHMLGGSLCVDSEEGAGTSIHFTIPARKRA